MGIAGRLQPDDQRPAPRRVRDAVRTRRRERLPGRRHGVLRFGARFSCCRSGTSEIARRSFRSSARRARTPRSPKWVETLNQAEQVSEVMRRAFNLLKMGRPGPVDGRDPRGRGRSLTSPISWRCSYRAVKATSPAGNPRDVAAAARVLVERVDPSSTRVEGRDVRRGRAGALELAELLQAPVMTTLEGRARSRRTTRWRSAPAVAA